MYLKSACYQSGLKANWSNIDPRKNLQEDTRQFFFLAWGFQGGSFGKWERSHPVKLLKSWGKIPLSSTSFCFFFFNDKVTPERKWKGKFLDFSSVQKAPGLFQNPVRVTVTCGHRTAIPGGLASLAIISIRNYNHQTTSQLLFWAHMLL